MASTATAGIKKIVEQFKSKTPPKEGSTTSTGGGFRTDPEKASYVQRSGVQAEAKYVKPDGTVVYGASGSETSIPSGASAVDGANVKQSTVTRVVNRSAIQTRDSPTSALSISSMNTYDGQSSPANELERNLRPGVRQPNALESNLNRQAVVEAERRRQANIQAERDREYQARLRASRVEKSMEEYKASPTFVSEVRAAPSQKRMGGFVNEFFTGFKENSVFSNFGNTIRGEGRVGLSTGDVIRTRPVPEASGALFRTTFDIALLGLDPKRVASGSASLVSKSAPALSKLGTTISSTKYGQAALKLGSSRAGRAGLDFGGKLFEGVGQAGKAAIESKPVQTAFNVGKAAVESKPAQLVKSFSRTNVGGLVLKDIPIQSTISYTFPKAFMGAERIIAPRDTKDIRSNQAFKLVEKDIYKQANLAQKEYETAGRKLGFGSKTKTSSQSQTLTTGEIETTVTKEEKIRTIPTLRGFLYESLGVQSEGGKAAYRSKASELLRSQGLSPTEVEAGVRALERRKSAGLGGALAGMFGASAFAEFTGRRAIAKSFESLSSKALDVKKSFWPLAGKSVIPLARAGFGEGFASELSSNIGRGEDVSIKRLAAYGGLGSASAVLIGAPIVGFAANRKAVSKTVEYVASFADPLEKPADLFTTGVEKGLKRYFNVEFPEPKFNVRIPKSQTLTILSGTPSMSQSQTSQSTLTKPAKPKSMASVLSESLNIGGKKKTPAVPSLSITPTISSNVDTNTIIDVNNVIVDETNVGTEVAVNPQVTTQTNTFIDSFTESSTVSSLVPVASVVPVVTPFFRIPPPIPPAFPFPGFGAGRATKGKKVRYVNELQDAFTLLDQSFRPFTPVRNLTPVSFLKKKKGKKSNRKRVRG